LAGTASLLNHYYEDAPNSTFTNTDNTEGTAVDTTSQTDYFFDKTNAPLSSWDFDNVWQENANDYPTLRSEF